MEGKRTSNFPHNFTFPPAPLLFLTVLGPYWRRRKQIEKELFGRLAPLSMTQPCVQGGIKQKAALWPEEINSVGYKVYSLSPLFAPSVPSSLRFLILPAGSYYLG
jgi:hypothetical protein